MGAFDKGSSPQSDIDVEINVMKEFSTDVNLNSNVLNTLHEEISVVDEDQMNETDLHNGEVMPLLQNKSKVCCIIIELSVFRLPHSSNRRNQSSYFLRLLLF